MRPEHHALLAMLLGVACATDVLERRVPNAVAVLVAVAGGLAQASARGAGGLGAGLGAGAALLAVLLVPWGLGKVGGGDVKLAAATAVWMGTDRVVVFAAWALAAGLPVALATRAAHRLGLWRLVRARAAAGGTVALDAAPETVPVAVSIALGAFAALWGAP